MALVLQKLANLQVFDSRENVLDKLNDLLERDKSKMMKFVEEISTTAHVNSNSEKKKKKEVLISI